MRRYSWIMAVLLLVLLTGALGVAAQDEPPPPVLAVLASAPDTPEARQELSYADYQALTGGIASEQAWMDALSGNLISGPALSDFLDRVSDQESLIGVPLFSVAQAATWGQVPAQTTLLQGLFDADAIAAAYAAREYSASPVGAFTLFCGPAGCDEGTAINPGERELGDPFGGHLGRQQPVLLAGQGDQMQLISSPVLEVLDASAGAAAGDVPSLADDAAYQAAVRAVTGTGTLLQAHFLNAKAFGPVPEGEALPPYALAVLAETEITEGLLATVTLVYPTLAGAEAAAGAVEGRMEAVVSEFSSMSFTALLKDRGVLFTTSAIEDADTGLGLTQIVFRAPDGEDSPYRLLVQGWMRLDLSWLALP
ncbi:MAG TPA: hypothetical protein VER79_07805 [Candidatus Limnocylindrales bacterium]|nr:hypothetical protein [Candidatus Limnocylindrales bacterium]